MFLLWWSVFETSVNYLIGWHTAKPRLASPYNKNIQGLVVQNLTKLLANVTLIFFILKYGKYIDIFYWENVSGFCKSYWLFCSKNINVFENVFASTVKELVINELVKLTMLWKTWPWFTAKALIRSWDFAHWFLLFMYVTKTSFSYYHDDNRTLRRTKILVRSYWCLWYR